MPTPKGAKNVGRPFPKGVSPNPKGRPRKPDDAVDVVSLARSYTVEAVHTLANIMRNGNHKASARVAAANALLDRAHGKPPQSMAVGGLDGSSLAGITVTFKHPDKPA